MAYYHLREKNDLKMNNVFKEPIKVSTDTKHFERLFDSEEVITSLEFH